MVQEHERGLGGWHAEWETLAEIFRLTAGALAGVKEIVSGAVVDTAAMRRDLDLLGGVTLAEAVSFELARKLGKAEAHRILEAVSRRAIEERIPMRQALLHEESLRPFFTPEDFDRMLDPANYLGSAGAFIESVLAAQSEQQPGKQKPGTHHAKD
jgi:3-carboxy-cis,cis-muconate cycloisomerase